MRTKSRRKPQGTTVATIESLERRELLSSLATYETQQTSESWQREESSVTEQVVRQENGQTLVANYQQMTAEESYYYYGYEAGGYQLKQGGENWQMVVEAEYQTVVVGGYRARENWIDAQVTQVTWGNGSDFIVAVERVEYHAYAVGVEQWQVSAYKAEYNFSAAVWQPDGYYQTVWYGSEVEANAQSMVRYGYFNSNYQYSAVVVGVEEVRAVTATATVNGGYKEFAHQEFFASEKEMLSYESNGNWFRFETSGREMIYANVTGYRSEWLTTASKSGETVINRRNGSIAVETSRFEATMFSKSGYSKSLAEENSWSYAAEGGDGYYYKTYIAVASGWRDESRFSHSRVNTRLQKTSVNVDRSGPTPTISSSSRSQKASKTNDEFSRSRQSWKTVEKVSDGFFSNQDLVGPALLMV